MKTVVAIHQPNFFPWLGYFNKLACADIFVVLDNVQVQKKGTWSNRVRLKINGEAKWVTMPIVRAYDGVRSIGQLTISGGDWRNRLLTTLRMAYGRAPCFDGVFPALVELVNNPSDLLADYNVAVVQRLASLLKLDRAKIERASRLPVVGRGTDLLVRIVRAVGGTVYLCGGGAAGYQEDERFLENGIDVVYQGFRHPVYPQRGRDFIPGLSIIDPLMNCGFEGTRALIFQSASMTRGTP